MKPILRKFIPNSEYGNGLLNQNVKSVAKRKLNKKSEFVFQKNVIAIGDNIVYENQGVEKKTA